MVIKKTVAKLLAMASAVTVLTAAYPASGTVKKNEITANAASAAVINMSKTYQSIDGFGGINHPEWYGDLTDADRKIAFGNGDGQLGCTILRVFVNPDKNQWNKALPTAQYATKNGITVFASPWEPPSNLAENGSAYGGKLHLPKRNYGAYAEHLNNFGKYMKDNGVDLYCVSVQNEPDYAKDWTAWTPDETTDFIANYGDKITSTRLMSPESFQYGAYNNGKDYYSKILNNAKAYANCDLFGTHLYGTPRNKMDFPALENCGKKLWMTEVYAPDSKIDANKWPDNLEQAVNIHDALVVGGMQAYVVWPLRRNYSIIYESTHSISKRGYIFGQYSKYIRPGDVRIDATEQPNTNILVSAYKHSDSQVQIVAINKGDSEVTQQFDISGRNIVNVDRYRTSGSENLAPTKNMSASGSTFYSQLPAKSVSTYIVTLDGGEVPTEAPTEPPTEAHPDKDGYWFHDTFEKDTFSWTGRGAASVLTSGRTAYVGSEALLVQDRTASWNGGEKPLDTSIFKPGNSYSFSVNAKYLEGGDTEKFKLTLEYKDANGDPQYSGIAEGEVGPDEWIQLANTSYKIPEDATDIKIYVETINTTSNFYIDEAIGAPEGTVIPGAGKPVIKTVILGDLNFDGKINGCDAILARRGLIKGISDKQMEKAADVDKNGKFELADCILINSFILGRIKEFPVPEKQDNKWDDYQETASAQYIKFYQDSIKQMGNVDRLAAKLEAAENGKSLTLAYLGGSITEGKNYSSPFSSYVDDTFAKGTFTEINAGLSGTSSVVGLVRSQAEIFSKNPDILVLEFSVNDHEDISYKKSFESLVKKALDQPNEPAVIILINRSKGGFSSQEQMYAIGKNFNVPVISMVDALTNAFNSGLLKTDDYFKDEYHPHEKGGQLVADCLAYFFRQAMKSENRGNGTYTMPSKAVYGTEYESCENVDISKLSGFNAGSWQSTTGYGKLPYGYKANGSTPMTFKTQGKGFIIVFKANSSNMGNITVTVNGKSTTIKGNKQYTWGGPDAEIGYYQDTTGDLDVSIKSEGGEFVIWGVGLIK